MKITRLTINGNKPTWTDLNGLESDLRNSLAAAGFETEVNLGAGKIGMRMVCFRIIPQRCGENVYVNSYTIRATKTGYKRTTLPTWGQRERFNHIVNDCFDENNASAKIVSGPYIVRSAKEGRVNSWMYPRISDIRVTLSGYAQCPSVLTVVPASFGATAVEWHSIKAPYTAYLDLNAKPKRLKVINGGK